MLDDTPHNLPATLRRLSDIVAEYDEKTAAIPATVEGFKAACTAAEMGATIGGTYARQVFERYTPSLSEQHLRANLLESAWKHVYTGLQLDKIAPASDRSRFDLALKNPAPFTLDNIAATFGQYIADPRGHILRGLAEAFGALDMAFKSHDRMKIGVKGLPKRIILNSVTSRGYCGRGTSQLVDILNALAVYLGVKRPTHGQVSAMLESALRGDGRLQEVLQPMVNLGEKIGYSKEVLGGTMPGVLGDLWLKRFANGNGHLFFGPDMLAAVNEALREYYGDVLPDCPEERPAKAAGSAIAKDLQFYRTPASVADMLVSQAGIRDGARVLEPSCGDGAILDALRRHAIKNRLEVRVCGVEYDQKRAAEAKAKGYSVHEANFLQVTPKADFDFVLMNPPFYGKHYQQHVEHARKFLKPGGTLLAILPITALTDHGFVTVERYGQDKWRDLPVGSFSESGTNINTGIATFFAA
jgi:hypothetical protein